MSVLEEIKSRLDIVEVVAEHVPLKRAGGNFRGLCPFHSEKTPSFMVSPEKQIFHCFGCGAGGDVLGFVMKQEGLSFQEALELLAKRAGVKLKAEGRGAAGERDSLKAVLSEAASFYADALGNSGGARAYLENRGITEKSIKDFRIGCAPDGWQRLYGHMRGKGFKDGPMLQSGLFSKGERGVYDIFRARITFPITDMQGDVIAFGGRVVEEGMPKYLNSPDTALFKKGETLYALERARDEIKKRGSALVVEGYLDVIMCHQNGISHAVAPLGTALTERHLKKLGRFTSNLILLFDGDAAGVSAAKRSLPHALSAGLQPGVLLLPAGEDPDSLLREKGPGVLEGLLKEALSPVEFILKSSAAGRREAIAEALDMIAVLGDRPLARDEFISELSDRTGARELTLREELARRMGKKERKSEAGPAGRALNEEHLLLSASIHAPEKIPYILQRVSLGELRDDAVRGIFGRLGGQKGSMLDAAETGEEKTLVSRLSVQPGFDLACTDKNIEDCINKLKLRRLQESIKAAQKAGDLKLLRGLLTERKELARGAG